MTRSVASRSLLVACSTASVLFFPARFALVPADIAFPTPDNAALKPMAAIPTEVSALASTMAEGAAQLEKRQVIQALQQEFQL